MVIRWIVFFSVIAFAPQAYGGEGPELKTQKDKVSYSIGLDIGNNLKRQSIELNSEALSAGIKDALSGADHRLSDEEILQVLDDYQKERKASAEKRAKETGEKNKKDGEIFLAKNKEKDGVITLPSGLQYKVVTAGTGKIPKSSDSVTTHYRGTLIDGTEFDSSYAREEPASFRVDRVISGWTEALQLMKVGSKWEIYIPSELAYGPRGTGQIIGPNSALIFEIELLTIKE